MPTVEITALDTLFFRDGKPFSMGEDSFATGIFPPPPSAFYGALRAAYFSDFPEEFRYANTQNDRSQYLVIKQIAYFNRKEKSINTISNVEIKKEHEEFLMLPAPADLVAKNDDNNLFLIHQLMKSNNTNAISPKINPYLNQIVNSSKGFIARNALNSYLRGKNDFYANHNNITTSEYKVGNALNKGTRTTQEGMLYRVQMQRMQNQFKSYRLVGYDHFTKKQSAEIVSTNERYSFIIEYEMPHISDWKPKFLRLGGEGKAVSVKFYNYMEDTHRSLDFKNSRIRLNFNGENRYFKLYFSTPVIFLNEYGFLPEDFDKDTLQGTWKGIRLQLLTAFIGKTISIGGYDIQKNQPKPMYKAIPEGSVYYFQVLDEGIEEDVIFAKFHQTALSEIWAEQGFGIGYVGNLEI